MALYKPAWHATAVALVAPGGHAYPALQLLHDPAPARANCPAGHWEGEKDPGGQAYPAQHAPSQDAFALPLDTPNRPALQLVQRTAPDTEANVPGPHCPEHSLEGKPELEPNLVSTQITEGKNIMNNMQTLCQRTTRAG